MRKIFLLGTALIALSIAAACSGGSSGDSATPSPSPSPSASPTATPAGLHWTLSVSASPHANQVGMARLKSTGSSTTSCAMVTLNASGVGTITTGGLMASTTYDKVELVLNLDGNSTFNQGTDHIYNHASITTGAVTSTNIMLTFDHNTPSAGGWVNGAGNTTPPAGFSWVNGTGCPGN